MQMAERDQQAWLDQVQEEALEPERDIVDPHHHLWHDFGVGQYLLEDLRRDTGAGHGVRKTMFMECSAEYDKDAPEHLRSVGETRFVAQVARQSREGASTGLPPIAGLVAHSDLRLPEDQLREALATHVEAGEGLFRGIRHALSCPPDNVELMIGGNGTPGMAYDPDFQRGVRLLGQLGYTYDSWHYHTQMDEFLAVAKAAPDTTMILDHFATPIGVGRFAGQREQIFSQWQADMRTLAACPNVHLKLGGLAMPDNGWGWHERDCPPTSDEFVQAQRDWYLHAIDCFGTERCMFESNFPVDRFSLSYNVYWNGVKKIVHDFSEADKSNLFSGTATRVYSLD